TRLSEFRSLTDVKLFDTAEKLLDSINKCNRDKRFIVFRNDVMHIKYSKGGYFKEHEDYLSITSNIIEEYSLLVCIDSSCQTGGRTILKLNDYCSFPSKATITPGQCLLFRKDIPHEGEVTDGSKEIITFNVWSIASDIKQILSVRFKDDTRRYCISFDTIRSFPDTMLARFISSKVGQDKSVPIVSFFADDTYEDFSIINDIYQGRSINSVDVRNNYSILDYYGFNYRDLLIKTLESMVKTSKPNMLSLGFNDEINEPDVVLFGNQADYLVFQDTVEQERLPYIPFTVVMAEGLLTYGGEMSGEKPMSIDMLPVFASFTENRHIMFIQNIMGTHIDILSDLYGRHINYNFDGINEGDRFITVSEVDAEDTRSSELIIPDTYSLEGQSIKYNLNATTDASNEQLVKMITHREFRPEFIRRSLHNADAIIERVRDIKLYNKIKNNMNNIHIPNTQRVNSIQDEFYCNENVYGNFNLIFIYGFLSIKV